MSEIPSAPATDPTVPMEPVQVHEHVVPMEPVQVHERVDSIDVLRGFALFGILAVNMMFYTTPLSAMNAMPPYWPQLHNEIATWLIEFFFMGKFYVLFSFLFGLGIAIQVDRAEARGTDILIHHLRRMLVLLGIGLIHAYLIWMGDILTTYALVGLLMLAFLGRRPKTCFIWALAIYAGVTLLFLMGILLLWALTFIPEVQAGIDKALGQMNAPEVRQAREESVRIYTTGSWLEITRLRAMEVLQAYVGIFFLQGWMVVVLFLLGLYVGKRGYFSRLSEYRGFLRKARWWALAVGLVANAAFLAGSSILPWDYFALKLGCILMGSILGSPTLSFFYVANILLLLTPENPDAGPTVWQQRLRPIALTGRMALTNYLMQSVLCSLIFYSYGLGQYAQLDPAIGLAITVGIYVVEILWSTWWMRRFRFGPMEWLWRSLTYGQVQPMRLPRS